MHFWCTPRNPKQPLRLFTESELRQRLGTLDADTVAKEIVMSNFGTSGIGVRSDHLGAPQRSNSGISGGNGFSGRRGDHLHCTAHW